MSGYELPQRQSRGKRLRQVIAEEEEAADAEFWTQEFFQEEARDEDYGSETEEEDVPDSDFDESESAEEDDSDADAGQDKQKRKVLKPPGAAPARKPPGPKKPPKAPAAARDASPHADGQAVGPSRRGGVAADSPTPPARGPSYEAPRLRRSTKQRTAEGEFNRKLAELTKPRRRVAVTDTRPLSQEELLAEAARTEVENLASLKLLVAREEETKRRATMIRKKYLGPSIKWRSVGVPAPPPPPPAAAAAAAAPTAGAAAHQQAEEAAAVGGGGGGAPAAAVPAAPAADGVTADGAADAGAEAAPARVMEHTLLQPHNTKALPRWLRPRRAPLPPPKPLCAITGAPARYCDPLTRQYYSTAAAFAELRRRAGRPLPAADAATPATAAQSRLQLGAGGVLFGVDPNALERVMAGGGDLAGAGPAAAGKADALYSENVMSLVVEFAQHQAAKMHGR